MWIYYYYNLLCKIAKGSFIILLLMNYKTILLEYPNVQVNLSKKAICWSMSYQFVDQSIEAHFNNLVGFAVKGSLAL